jgi:hypothetical protein
MTPQSSNALSIAIAGSDRCERGQHEQHLAHVLLRTRRGKADERATDPPGRPIVRQRRSGRTLSRADLCNAKSGNMFATRRGSRQATKAHVNTKVMRSLEPVRGIRRVPTVMQLPA